MKKTELKSALGCRPGYLRHGGLDRGMRKTLGMMKSIKISIDWVAGYKDYTSPPTNTDGHGIQRVTADILVLEQVRDRIDHI